MPGKSFDNQFPTQKEKDMYHAIKKKLLEDGMKEDAAKTKAAKITHTHYNKDKK